jgi:hypothetical protein
VLGSNGVSYNADYFDMDLAGNPTYKPPEPPAPPAQGSESEGPVWDWGEDNKPSKATRNLYKGKSGEDVKNL